MATGNQLSFIETNQITVKHGVTLFFDGAARNNPGPAGAGICIKKDKEILYEHGFFLGDKTNNQAEYLALIIGLLTVKKYLEPETSLAIYSDSELLIKQMTGHYRVKNPTLQHLFNVAYLLSKDLHPKFNYISRVHNKDADRLANHGIDTHNVVPEPIKRVLHEYHITF